MAKLSAAIAASALVLAISAPGFAQGVGPSTSGQSTIQDRDTGNTATPMQRDRDSSGTRTPQRSDTQSGSGMSRDQSAQMPGASDSQSDMRRNRSLNAAPGASRSSPGHEMQENGSVPGQPGASGYAPGR